MSKIKNSGLDQYHGTKLFEQQQCGTAGVEGVKALHLCYVYQQCNAHARSVDTRQRKHQYLSFWFIKLYSPYQINGSKQKWQMDKKKVRKGLNQALFPKIYTKNNRNYPQIVMTFRQQLRPLSNSEATSRGDRKSLPRKSHFLPKRHRNLMLITAAFTEICFRMYHYLSFVEAQTATDSWSS